MLKLETTNIGYGAVDEAISPLTRGRGFDPGYGENSVRERFPPNEALRGVNPD